MIDIYFVRHGQTDGNRAKRHQAENTGLTKKGKKQAGKAGVWAKTVHPTHFLVSDRVRALQTSQIIGEEIQMIGETNPVFTELKRPESVYGNRHSSIKSIWYLFLWYFGIAGGDGNDKDGESYKVFRDRLGEAQKTLEVLPDNSKVIVVSHAVFISFMVSHLCNKNPIGFLEAYRLFSRLLTLCNGSYTHVQYDPSVSKDVCSWSLVSYNNCKQLE